MIEKIADRSFNQLIFIYAILAALFLLGILNDFVFWLLVPTLAILWMLTREEGKTLEMGEKFRKFIIILAFVIFVISRITPYLGSAAPGGYDVGIYKYAFEHGLENKDAWILEYGMEPGFLYLIEALKILFSVEALMTWGFLLFGILAGIALYLFTKESFGKDVAAISLLIYSLSMAQYRLVTMFYYKNLIGIALMLFAFYLLDKSEKNKKYLPAFIAVAGVLGGLHRLTFYVFGLTYLSYAFLSPIDGKKYDWRKMMKNVLVGIAIVSIACAFYMGDFNPQITGILKPLASSFTEPGKTPGTFMNIGEYFHNSFPYLLFSIIGMAYVVKKKNLLTASLFITTLASACLGLFFFNRMIVFFDIAAIISAAIGMLVIARGEKIRKISIALLIALLIFLSMQASFNAEPSISQGELDSIISLNETPAEAYVLCTSSIYSPWLLGYSERKIIAPGLFDYNLDSKEGWQEFWDAKNESSAAEFLRKYPRPLYIFEGSRQKRILDGMEGGCFRIIHEQRGNKVYEYTC